MNPFLVGVTLLPYVKLLIPELPLERKRSLVRELTDGLMDALRIPHASADWCTIHIIPLRAENVSVGGRLVADHAEASYLVEVTDRELSTDARQSVVEQFQPILMRYLGLRPDQSFSLNFKFNVCEAKDFAVGGQFLNEYHERQAIAQPVARRL